MITIKKDDLYKHFKGDLYKFECIAIPKLDPSISEKLLQRMKYIESVRFHENTYDIKVFEFMGIYFIEAAIPHVIYYNNENDLKWARPVDDFFGYKEKEEKWIKRFTKQEEES